MDFNPIVLSIPIFFILIGIELIIERFSKRHLYRLPDAIGNLSCGITQQISGLFLKVFAVGIYEILYQNFALFTLETNWIYWVSLFFLVDLAYYWAHRMSHEVNLFWGGHIVHHQSEDYNLSVALRQSSLQVIWTMGFNLPLALIGFETTHFVIMSAFNTLYQFWIHTETIKKMGWFEYFFNTPSHHRVHHGRNPKYIDKNHAGVLIIWDKMFGTFQQEEEHPIYGITKPINSWNALYANVSHYVEMGKDLKRITRWRDKIKYLFMKPGWLPEDLGGYQAAPEIDPKTYYKYDTCSPTLLNWYVLFQYAITLGGTSLFLFNEAHFAFWEKVFFASLIAWTVVNCGVLFENRKWAIRSEWLRIVFLPCVLAYSTFYENLPPWCYGIALGYFIISAFWYYTYQKKK